MPPPPTTYQTIPHHHPPPPQYQSNNDERTNLLPLQLTTPTFDDDDGDDVYDDPSSATNDVTGGRNNNNNILLIILSASIIGFTGFVVGLLVGNNNSTVVSKFLLSSSRAVTIDDGAGASTAALVSDQHQHPVDRMTKTLAHMGKSQQIWYEREYDIAETKAFQYDGLDMLGHSSSKKAKARQHHHDYHHHHHDHHHHNEEEDASSKKHRLIYLNHPTSYQYLLLHHKNKVSPYSYDYFLLNTGLDVQMNQAYCAVATTVAVLNSFRFLHDRTQVGIDIVPTSAIYDPYPYATQLDLFGPCTELNVIHNGGLGVMGKDGILKSPFGLGMDQVVELLRCHLNATSGWVVKGHHLNVNTTSLNQMREDIKGALLDPHARVMVNYYRSAAGQIGGGHWSPLGSYNEALDSFLLLDVAKYKYPPVWIPSVWLYESMGTYDSCGSWDYPEKQDELTEKQDELTMLNVTMDEEEFEEYEEKAEKVLGCRETLRGYVIVRKG